MILDLEEHKTWVINSVVDTLISAGVGGGIKYDVIIKEVDRLCILRVLAASGNNKTKAAKFLGINRTTMIERMRRHNMILNPRCVASSD
jgi:DNA-binding protein Fis